MLTRRGFKFHMKNFSEWKPKIPRHKTIIDTNSYRAPHQVWELKDAEKVEITHFTPETIRDKAAFLMMKGLRKSFDFFTRYKPGQMNEARYLRRCIFLETVAGVPGMIGGIVRHFAALRLLREDGGWIHHLLEEAENERMHLLTFLQLKKPTIFERATIVLAQFIFVVYYSAMYLLSYKLAHRFVGYLEEEAVKTYTNIIKELDEGRLPDWKDLKASPEAIKYWALPEKAKMRDVLLAIRADEVAHKEFNHHFADMNKNQQMTREEYYIKDEKPIKWN
jgi:hypothetical protein